MMTTHQTGDFEAALCNYVRTFPSKAFSRKTLAEVMRVRDYAALDLALRNLCLRGELEQVHIRMVVCWQARTSQAHRIANARPANDLRGYVKELYRHYRAAEAAGGRA
jgi:hypothetical protein